MKLFISQPMQGKSEAEIIAARKALIADAAVMLQTDALEVLRTVYTDDAPPLDKLGRALQALATADAAIFAPGWQAARGCKIEHMAAEEYGVQILEVQHAE